MLDYARQRATEALEAAQTAVLATNGPAGIQVSEAPCEAVGLCLYVLLPQTSDHLFNLEHDAAVTLLTRGWELRGKARRLSPLPPDLDLELLRRPDVAWCALVCVRPCQIQLRRQEGWGNLETIDVASFDRQG